MSVDFNVFAFNYSFTLFLYELVVIFICLARARRDVPLLTFKALFMCLQPMTVIGALAVTLIFVCDFG